MKGLGTNSRRGLTLVELLAVCATIGLLVLLLIPAVQGSREAARRAQCASRLRQIGLATGAYEGAHGVYPAGRELPDWIQNGTVKTIYTHYREVNQQSSKGEVTGFRAVQVWLLPFLGDETLFGRMDLQRPISMRMTINGRPYNVNYDVYTAVQGEFLCPSDLDRPARPCDNSYRYNFGGSTPYAGAVSTRLQASHDVQLDGLPVLGNGAFTAGQRLRVADFGDGLSKTAFFSERLRGSGRSAGSELPTRGDVITMPERTTGVPNRSAMYQVCGEYQPTESPFNFMSAGSWLEGSDYSNGWPFAGYASTMYNHVAPPNWSGYDCGSWSAIADTPGEHAIITARSNHSGIVNVLFGDGHVDAIGDDIELDTWRRMGNRSDER